MYDTLIAEGKNLQQQGAKLAEDVSGDLRKQVEGTLGRVMSAANDNYQFVESKVGEGVGRVLGRMGVPSRDDIVELSKRVAELSKQVKLLQNGRKSALLGDAQAA
jgi:poly(hydroxyalkanoate) granule-associated protein